VQFFAVRMPSSWPSLPPPRRLCRKNPSIPTPRLKILGYVLGSAVSFASPPPLPLVALTCSVLSLLCVLFERVAERVVCNLSSVRWLDAKIACVERIRCGSFTPPVPFLCPTAIA
jgi:hypothetical protein